MEVVSRKQNLTALSLDATADGDDFDRFYIASAVTLVGQLYVSAAI